MQQTCTSVTKMPTITDVFIQIDFNRRGFMIPGKNAKLIAIRGVGSSAQGFAVAESNLPAQ